MSLEAEHKTKIEEFNKYTERVEELNDKLRQLRKDKETEACIYALLKIDDQIHLTETDLAKINNNNISRYLLDVSPIFFDYGNTQNISSVFSDMHEQEHAVSMKSFVQQRTQNNRGQLYNQYMNIVNSAPPVEYYDANAISFVAQKCKDCNSTMSVSVNESYIVCEKCGYFEAYFDPSITGLTYEQEVNTDTNVNFAYKRINHLRELLAQLQAKESSEIPEEVINCIKSEFKKTRVINPAEITQEKVKYHLKKMNLNKYYEHTRQIANILTGTPPPVISNQLYETIINMFMEIQEPFDQVCPKNRKNFFSYNYILFKFCELLDEKEHMTLFPLLKSREKLYQQDCIWKDICIITKWPFIKSV